MWGKLATTILKSTIDPKKGNCKGGVLLKNGLCNCPQGKKLVNGDFIADPKKGNCKGGVLKNGICNCLQGKKLIKGDCVADWYWKMLQNCWNGQI